jgi:arylsulfatase A-like enzyme
MLRLAPPVGRPSRWPVLAIARSAALAMLLACDRSPRVVTRFQDLVVQPGGHVRVFDRTTGTQHCADESFLGIAVADGGRRTYRIDLDGPTDLLVGGCAAGPGAPRATLVLAATGAGGNRWERRVELAATARTLRLRLDLPPGRARLRLTARGGARVRDLALATREKAAAAPPAPRVLLVSLDAFREDAVGALGGGARTPALDAFLAEAERFTPHWAADISTKPSHATLLSGLPVAVHRCDRGEEPLAAEVSTLAERLRAAGVDTAGFASGAPYFHPRLGLGQGFDHWQPAAWTSAQQLRAVTNWLADHRQRPFFLFVHLYAAHSDAHRLPYEAPGVTPALVAQRFGLADYGCRRGACASRMLAGLNAGTLPKEPADREVLRFLYDRGVEALDADLGAWFATLRASGLWDDLLVAVTADHGEQFGEHGAFLHTTAHEETLRVPLLVKWPRGRRGGETALRPSSSLDLAPTILAAFGLPAADLLGEDLARPARRAALLVARDAVRDARHKVLLATPQAPAALFDLLRDPGERSPLPVDQPAARRLLAARERMFAEARRRSGALADPGAAPFTPQEAEQLRALGYAQ